MVSPVNFLLALNFLIINVIYGLEDLRDALNMFCILISKVISGLCVLSSCCFCLATVVLIPFVIFGSGLVWLMSGRPVTV